MRTPKARMPAAGLTFPAAFPVGLTAAELPVAGPDDVGEGLVVCDVALVEVLRKVLPPLVMVATTAPEEAVPLAEIVPLVMADEALAMMEDAAPAAELMTEPAEEEISPAAELAAAPAEETTEAIDERGSVLGIPEVTVAAGAGVRTGVAPALPALVVAAPKVGGGFAAPHPSQSARRLDP